MLISIETHITCDFQGGGGEGSGPPIPPLDPHLNLGLHWSFSLYFLVEAYWIDCNRL